ncbi:uncharacterized protein EV420DRAFT_1642342 [Desarmillaria tabescens]|uniref:Uncharacterized protein n=1 Tax=Armillaria tabescens TaxID=1929756 RepID=A0AA39N606_ARMTA|nr:uncharacterized protein EV420DRAFT_1642342 [Desarmillaria tabescens]KAK0459376.1 hypothetical protein EV420DRAFT_1642342 [Desarmillaria tabescens]
MSYSYLPLLLTDAAIVEAVSAGAHPLIFTNLIPSAIPSDHALPSSPRVEDEKGTGDSCVEKEIKQKTARDGGFLRRFMTWWKGQQDEDTDNRGNIAVYSFLDGPIASPSALFLASTRSLDAYEWALDIGGRRRSLHSDLST